MARWNKGSFKVLNTSLDPQDVDQRYLEVMQDVHIDKTGKFEIIDKKLSIDPATGDTVVALEYIERQPLEGPQDDDDLM